MACLVVCLGACTRPASELLATATPTGDISGAMEATMASIATDVAIDAAKTAQAALPTTATPAITIVAPPSSTATGPAPTATFPAATNVPTEAPTQAAASPSPTSLAEGLGTRLGTPDPSPNCPDHYPWFFENPANECADVVLNTWIVWQPFDGGLMVWTQEKGRTLVLVDNRSVFKSYAVVVDGQGLPFPEPDPSIVPPEGRFQPERGFAIFWRGLAVGSEWVRGALGWATEPESAYSGLWQCNKFTDNAARCYFTGPRDEIVVLAMGQAAYWNYWQRAVR